MNQIEIYQTTDGETKIDVKFSEDTVWLSQQQMAMLFRQTKQNISLHINNLYRERELVKKATVKESLTVQKEGGRRVSREIELYNLDVIISVGYRVKSQRGTQFRQWATGKLKDYLVKGYALNQKRLQQAANRYYELQEAVQLITKVSTQKSLTANESHGILKILEE